MAIQRQRKISGHGVSQRLGEPAASRFGNGNSSCDEEKTGDASLSCEVICGVKLGEVSRIRPNQPQSFLSITDQEATIHRWQMIDAGGRDRTVGGVAAGSWHSSVGPQTLGNSASSKESSGVRSDSEYTSYAPDVKT